MHRYCLPILSQSTAAVDAALAQHNNAFNYFEIWLDYLSNVSVHWLEDIAQRWGERLIFVTRRLQLEPIQTPFRQRVMLLGAIAETKAKVDFDVGTQQDDISFWRSCSSMEKVVLSFHDYEATPSDDDLTELFAYMAKLNPWLCKSASFCQRPEDGIRLLQWIRSFPARHPHQAFVILGMGEHGLCTRVFGPQWGNAISFAPATSTLASAPGQLTRRQYDELFALLSVTV